LTLGIKLKSFRINDSFRQLSNVYREIYGVGNSTQHSFHTSYSQIRLVSSRQRISDPGFLNCYDMHSSATTLRLIITAGS